jgi:3'-phosphoadenosine 5'-phosphosulfate sulfotransferase (PAPS reductase)/FAD synthetase
MKQSKIFKKLLNTTTITDKTIYVVSISGGKDSKATLIVSLPLLLKVVKPSQIKVVFCDTGWEKQETMDELETIKAKLKDFGIEFLSLSNPKYPNGMTDLLLHKKIFPSRLTKFCTEELKMIPALNYYKELALQDFDVVVLVGKRRDESTDRVNTLDVQFEKKKDYSFTIYHPIADWTETDVYSCLDETWGIPSSYFNGNTRVGCDECFQANLKAVSLMSEDKIKQMEEVEEKINNHHSDYQHDRYAFFYKKSKTFPQGYAPIREIVNYAKEKHNFNYFTFHTRALKKMSDKIGQKTLRYKFIQSGYIPNKSNFSKYINGILAVPQSMQFDVEVLTTKILTAKERSDLLKFEKLEEISKEDSGLSCSDCESYNLL